MQPAPPPNPNRPPREAWYEAKRGAAGRRPWYALGIPIAGMLVGLRMVLRLFASHATPDYAFPYPPLPSIDYASLIRGLDAGSLVTTPAEPPPPVRMVADATNVYLADPDTETIAAIPKASGTRRVLVEQAADVGGFAVSGAKLYFTSNHTVQAVSVTGGAAKVIASGLERPQKVAVDAKWIFVVDSRTTAGALHGVVLRIPVGGGDPTTMVTCVGEASGLAIDDGNVYVSDALSGDVLAVAKQGGDARVVAPDRDSPVDLASDGAALYWIEVGTLWRLPKGAPGPKMIAGSAGGVVGLSAAPSAAFYVVQSRDKSTFSVVRAARDGSGEGPIVAGPPSEVNAIATDGKQVYWSSEGDVWSSTKKL